jgi:hypothetical protein
MTSQVYGLVLASIHADKINFLALDIKPDSLAHRFGNKYATLLNTKHVDKMNKAKN